MMSPALMIGAVIVQELVGGVMPILLRLVTVGMTTVWRTFQAEWLACSIE